jgi:peroxiredoxin Q/BCP
MPLINPGQPAPNFNLRDAHGERHSLSDFRGRSLVIYFYPEDDTPLCTAQACQFRDHHGEFGKVGCSVIGISPDDGASHGAFIARHQLPFPLLVDETGKDGNPRISMMYGAWGDKNMYGNIVRAMLRTTYLIGPDGKVARRWDRVKTPGHAAKVLAAAKALHSGGLNSVVREAKPAKHPRTPSRAKPTAGRNAFAGVRTSKAKNTPVRAAGAKARAKTARRLGSPR